MRLTFCCPACGRGVQTDVSPQTSSIGCNCGWNRALQGGDWANGEPAHCLVCDNADLWRQKDLPQRVGLAAIAVQIVVSTFFWFRHEPLWTYGTLMLFAVLDMVLYVVMPDVLVCYRCQARHRTSVQQGEHGSFDHTLAERYRQERLRSDAGQG
jgi:hypothetical protein